MIEQSRLDVTRVPPVSGSALTRETIVADAPPLPRLSVPRALIVATRCSSSSCSIFSAPVEEAVVGPSFTVKFALNVPSPTALVIAAPGTWATAGRR